MDTGETIKQSKKNILIVEDEMTGVALQRMSSILGGEATLIDNSEDLDNLAQNPQKLANLDLVILDNDIKGTNGSGAGLRFLPIISIHKAEIFWTSTKSLPDEYAGRVTTIMKAEGRKEIERVLKK